MKLTEYKHAESVSWKNASSSHGDCSRFCFPLGDLAQDGQLRHRLLPLPLRLVLWGQPTLLRLNPALPGSRLPHRRGERNNLPGLDTELDFVTTVAAIRSGQVNSVLSLSLPTCKMAAVRSTLVIS